MVDNDSFSPSAGKPALLINQWKERWAEVLEFIEPQPVSEEELSLAHDPELVRNILACKIPNGFSNYSKEVAASLLWTNGSFLSASRYVQTNGGAACSPTSGFHHAGYHFASAFCTFNGLMVAAVEAGRAGLRVGVLDCDYHYAVSQVLWSGPLRPSLQIGPGPIDRERRVAGPDRNTSRWFARLLPSSRIRSRPRSSSANPSESP